MQGGGALRLWRVLRQGWHRMSAGERPARDIEARIRAIVGTVRTLMPVDGAQATPWRARIDGLVDDSMEDLLREGEYAPWLEILCSNLDDYDIPIPDSTRAELIALCRLVGADHVYWPRDDAGRRTLGSDERSTLKERRCLMRIIPSRA